MKIKKGILILCLLYMQMVFSNTILNATTETNLTTSEINKIITNKDGFYGLPNKYWNKETGEFIIPEGYTKIDKTAMPTMLFFEKDDKKNQVERCLIIDLVKKVIVPNSITCIEDGAFANSTLEAIEIPDTVSYIGKNAFCQTMLKNIKWPKATTTIEENMFTYSNIESIDIPNTVTLIKSGAFASTRLTDIYIPDSVMEIGPNAFFECSDLKNVRLPKNLVKIENGVFDATAIENINIPDTVKEMGAYSFAGCKFKQLKLSEKLYKIDINGLFFCTELESVEMTGITKLGDYAFSNCNNLNRLVISKKFLTSSNISKKAFDACPEDWYDKKALPVKDNSVDVYVVDGVDGINIEKILKENRWMKSLQEMSIKNNKTKYLNEDIPNTGLSNAIILISILISLWFVSLRLWIINSK